MAKQKAKKMKKGAPLVSLHDLFVVKLYELYDIETTIVKALPKMIKKAENEELQALLQKHLEVTEGQLERLEQVFEQVGERMKTKKSAAIKGMVTDAEALLKLKGEPTVLDAGIISAAQGVEHIEIAYYGTVLTWAELMGHEEAVSLLEETLEEEIETDDKLTELAERVVNVEAMGNDDTEEEEDEEEMEE